MFEMKIFKKYFKLREVNELGPNLFYNGYIKKRYATVVFEKLKLCYYVKVSLIHILAKY